MDEPSIRLHVRGGEVMDALEWPLPGTDWTELHLRRSGALAPEPEPVEGYPDVFTQQPVQEQPEVQTVAYLTLPMVHGIELIGPGAVTLFASIDARDTNWMVSLLDVFPSGIEVEFNRGYLKASHRAVDERKSEPWRPWHPHTEAEDVAPGEVYEYRIELSPMSTVIAAGHRLKLSISCLDHARWPPVDPELGTMHQPWHVCRNETVSHSIFHDRRYRSRVLLPYIKR
jgi:putative CocE/NonD family hydrolase